MNRLYETSSPDAFALRTVGSRIARMSINGSLGAPDHAAGAPHVARDAAWVHAELTAASGLFLFR